MSKKLFWSRDKLDRHEFDCLGPGLGLGLGLTKRFYKNLNRAIGFM